MSELARTISSRINIVAERTVLTYTYSSAPPLVAMGRIDLGSVVNPIVGGGAYQIHVSLNGARISPEPPIPVTAGVLRTVLISRPIALQQGDLLLLSCTGLAGDVAVDVVASLRDITPVSLADLTGGGPVIVDHNYGGANNLTYLTPGGLGIPSANIQAYLKTDYDANRRDNNYVVARTSTTAGGQWARSLALSPAVYTFIFNAPGLFGPDRRDVTVA